MASGTGIRVHRIVGACAEAGRNAALLGAVVSTLAVAGPPPARGQTLDEAVARQLEVSGGLECGILLSGNPGNVAALEGELVTICTRGLPAGGPGGGNSGGGGAATPTSPPKVIEKRARRSDGDESNGASTPGTTVATSSSDLGGGIGVFLSAEYQELERDVTRFEDGFDSETARGTFGIDRRFDERWIAGIAVDASTHDGDFDGGGDFDGHSVGGLVFASFAPADWLAIDGNAGYARAHHERTRVASFVQLDSAGAPDFTTAGRPDGDYDADEVFASLLATGELNFANVSVSPSAGVDLRHVAFESYTEEGSSGLALEFQSDDETRLRSRAGIQTAVALSTPFGVLLPLVSLEWVHEFQDDQRRIRASFTGDTRRQKFSFQTERPDRNFFPLGAGASFVLPGGFQAFALYRTLLGHEHLDSHSVAAGLRGEF